MKNPANPKSKIRKINKSKIKTETIGEGKQKIMICDFPKTTPESHR
jgi:hypothetical protein